jgi:sulfoxide reductase catalytic subunit YedY
MLIKKADDIKSSEITDKNLYLNRRLFLRGAALAGGAAATGLVYRYFTGHNEVAQSGDKIADVQAASQTAPPINEKSTPYEDITNYNNFYEFSTDKLEVANKARRFITRPWTVTVEGLVQKPRTFDIDDLLKISPPEERIYRHRCVRAMVDGDSVGRIPSGEASGSGSAVITSEIRRLRDTCRSETDAGAALRCVGLALRGRLAVG